jgi:hypothetical protein
MDSRYVAGSQFVFAVPQRFFGGCFSPSGPCDRVDDAPGPRQFVLNFHRVLLRSFTAANTPHWLGRANMTLSLAWCQCWHACHSWTSKIRLFQE